MKHKHAELIKAWADGAKIQLWWADGWVDSENPNWGGEIYRIKPEQKPEPVKKTMYLYFVGSKEKVFWISEEPPETYLYRTISDYIGSVEVTK